MHRRTTQPQVTPLAGRRLQHCGRHRHGRDQTPTSTVISTDPYLTLDIQCALDPGHLNLSRTSVVLPLTITVGTLGWGLRPAGL
jgi:hypothetical protein